MKRPINTIAVLGIKLVLLTACSNTTQSKKETVTQQININEWTYDSVPTMAPACIDVEAIEKNDIALTNKAGIGAKYAAPTDTLYYNGTAYTGIIKECYYESVLSIRQYQNGVFSGLAVLYNQNDEFLYQVFEGADGYIHGRIKQYKNGYKEVEGTYKKGFKEGAIRHFDRDGIVRKIDSYKDGAFLKCEGDCS